MYAAISLDGYIAVNSRTVPKWTSTEDWQWFQAELAKADVLIVGRTTFELAKKRLQKRNTVVLTSKVKTITRAEGVVWINPKKINFAEYLSMYRRVAIIGGAQVYAEMLAQKLCTDVYLTVEPVILGSGIPWLPKTISAQMKLYSVKKLNKRGTILLHYQIK